MPEIHTPVPGFSGDVAGVVFTDGVGHAEDEGALNYFRRHGHVIVADGEPSPDGAPDSTWKNADIKAWATEAGIDLGEATKKDDMLAVIAAASIVEPSADEASE